MRHIPLFLTTLLLLAGCEDKLPGGSGTDGGIDSAPDIAECAVFFTELQADPDGADAEGEFVELYNPGAEPVNLGGCRLELRSGDAGATKRESILGELVVPPMDYIVLGPETALAVNYNWRSLGALPNSSSGGTVTLSVVCGNGPVTSVSYLTPEGGGDGLGDPSGGRSFQLGANTLTCQAGKSGGNWCTSPDEAASGENYETRRTANSACAGPAPDCALSACGLFFTEFLADPTTDDSENEYVELYNPSDDVAQLGGCALEIQKGDRDPTVHLIAGEVAVDPQDFLLLGPENANQVAYNWSSLGDLPNTSSTGAVTMRLRNPTTGDVVDSFTYLTEGEGLGDPARGRSYQLCRDTGFNCDGNDVAANWSVSDVGAADAENRGTPGVANRPCVELTCNATSCDGEVGAERRIEGPAVGELVITEIYANPPQTPEGDFEWFEVHNASGRDLDLNGVEVWRRENTQEADYIIGNGASCVTIAAGEYATMAAKQLPEQNGGLDVCAGFGYGRGFSLVNSNGYLSLRVGEAIIDEVRWTRTPEGRSLELSPTCELTAEANDDPACWCPSQRPAQQGEAGLVYNTAGGENEACDACYCSVGADWRRADNVFGRGELEITEFLTNVPGNEADNPGWEFVEVRATVAGQLNCGALREGEDDDTEFPWTECFEMAPGDHLVLAGSDVPAENGGLPEANTRSLGPLTLKADGGRLAVVIGGEEIDVVDDYPAGGEGISVQKDPVSGALCDSTQQYSFDPPGFGTPGADNDACP